MNRNKMEGRALRRDLRVRECRKQLQELKLLAKCLLDIFVRPTDEVNYHHLVHLLCDGTNTNRCHVEDFLEWLQASRILTWNTRDRHDARVKLAVN